MNSRYLAECRRGQPSILRRWTDLLQIEPGWQYVEATSHFTKLMEKILVQLWSELLVPTDARWAWCRPVTIELPRWDPSRCGLDIVLPFVNSGKAAIREVMDAAGGRLAGVTPVQGARLQWELLLVFESMAQRGIEQVCGHCRLGGDCSYSGRAEPRGLPEGSRIAGTNR
jgi:hypothetical protein